MRKIEAFTLYEIVVVLLVSSIVVALAFELLGLFNKQLSYWKDNFNYEEEVELIGYTLLTDLNTHRVCCNVGSDVLVCYSYTDTIYYTLKEHILTRNYDTISKHIDSNKFYFAGDRVQKGNVDAVFMSFDNNGYSKELFISTQKDAKIYFERELTNGF